MSQHPEPTDAEIAGGDYQPYQTHTGGELAPTASSSTAPAKSDDGANLDETAGTQQFVLGIVSLGTGIPITAIAATNVEPGLIGVAIAWAGIIGVNFTHYMARRRKK